MSRFDRRPIKATIRAHGSVAGTDFDERLREALSHWTSGVAVLASSDGEEIDAITVSAFTSLSIDPPLVLLSVGEQASILPMLREVGRFVVSILSQDQQPVAGSIAQRLPDSESSFVAADRPAVRDSLATLDCTLWEEYPGGDHRIVVGRVESVSLGPDARPLVYHRRSYRTLS